MSEGRSVQSPKWFMIVSLIAFVWNLLGVTAYIMQATMSPETLAALPDAERALLESTPAWATAAYAIAVHGGALGCLFLILRKTWAVPLLELSFLGVIVQMFHSIFIANSIEVHGPGGMTMPVMVIVISFYLVFLARSAKARRWLS
jgi:hypothetical protein